MSWKGLLLRHVCLPGSLSYSSRLSARLTLDEFTWNLVLETFIKICLETPNVIKIGQKNIGNFTLRPPKYIYIFLRRDNIYFSLKTMLTERTIASPNQLQQFCNIDRGTCSSTLHTKSIVYFPTQQWLRERAMSSTTSKPDSESRQRHEMFAYSTGSLRLWTTPDLLSNAYRIALLVVK